MRISLLRLVNNKFNSMWSEWLMDDKDVSPAVSIRSVTFDLRTDNEEEMGRNAVSVLKIDRWTHVQTHVQWLRSSLSFTNMNVAGVYI